MVIEKETHIINSSTSGHPIAIDITYQQDNKPKPVVVFAHGFKGFKDWGHFPMIATHFAEHGFAFLKFNFSGNGTTPEHPVDFVDLEAFGHNTFSQELTDLDAVIDFLLNINHPELNSDIISLLGHSRGGATCLIKSVESTHITAVATWAGVLDIVQRYASENLEPWKHDGVQYVLNGRTNQQMPLYFGLAEDIFNQRTRYDIPKRLDQTDKPTLLIYGNSDDVVPPSQLDLINRNNPLIETRLIKDANHTFGGTHPYKEVCLPPATMEACAHTISFFNHTTKS